MRAKIWTEQYGSNELNLKVKKQKENLEIGKSNNNIVDNKNNNNNESSSKRQLY